MFVFFQKENGPVSIKLDASDELSFSARVSGRALFVRAAEDAIKSQVACLVTEEVRTNLFSILFYELNVGFGSD